MTDFLFHNNRRFHVFFWLDNSRRRRQKKNHSQGNVLAPMLFNVITVNARSAMILWCLLTITEVADVDRYLSFS